MTASSARWSNTFGRGLLRTFAVPGHCDGLRIDPATHKVWASSNEDGNPGLVSIEPASGTITKYSFEPDR